MKKITIITGHYGSGKTTIAINKALNLKQHNKDVTIIDLDIINPFFRTTEYSEMLHQNGIKTILPNYGGTTSDMPALSPQINAMFNDSDTYYILDVGGDDVGATVLGQYATRLKEVGYDMFFVVNQYRYMTQTPAMAEQILREIESSSRLNATGIIDNTNLGSETTPELLQNSTEFISSFTKEVGLPIIQNETNFSLLSNLKSV